MGCAANISAAVAGRTTDAPARAPGRVNDPRYRASCGALVRRVAGRPQVVNFFDELPPAFSTTRDTTSLNVGGEHLLLREGSVIPLRLGFAWEPQGPMSPYTRDPSEFFLVAFGGGYNTNSVKFDAAVQYRWGGVRVGESYTAKSLLERVPDAFGNVRAREWRLKFSAIYRIP